MRMCCAGECLQALAVTGLFMLWVAQGRRPPQRIKGRASATCSQQVLQVRQLSQCGLVVFDKLLGDMTLYKTLLLFSFVPPRPPGHHAERDNGGGYCIFNNVAVAAHHALAHHHLSRVAIVDYDVHHGNGTQVWPDLQWNTAALVAVRPWLAPPGTSSSTAKDDIALFATHVN